METTEQNVNEGRRLFGQGAYERAVSLLRQLHERDQHDLDVTLELIEVLVGQGYINRAQDVTKEESWDKEPMDNPSLLAIGMIHCFLEAVSSGLFRQPVENARRIFAAWSNLTDPAHPTRAQVTTIIYYSKLQQLLFTFQVFEYQPMLSDVTTQLAALFGVMMETSAYDMALKIARTMSEPTQKVSFLQRLISEPAVSSLIKGKALAERGRTLELSDDRRANIMQQAANLLRSHHDHELLDIEYETALRTIQHSPQISEANFDSFLVEYQSMDYMNGLKSALHKLLDLCQKLFNWDMQFRIEEKLKDLSLRTGTYALWLSAHVNLLARYKLRSGNNDIVRESLELIWPALTNVDMRWIQGQAAYLLSEIYIDLLEEERALTWVGRCEDTWGICNSAAISGAHFQRTRLGVLQLQKFPTLDPGAFIERTEGFVLYDYQENLVEQGIMKLEILIAWYLTGSDFNDTRKAAAVRDLIVRIEHAVQGYNQADKPFKIAGLYQQNAALLSVIGAQHSHCQFESQAVSILGNALQQVLNGSTGTLTFQLIMIVQQRGLLLHKCFVKHQAAGNSQCGNDHDGAIAAFKACVESFESIGTTTQIAEAKYWLALQSYEGRLMGWINSETLLDRLRAAEEGFDLLRADISASKGLDAIRRKRLLSGNKHVRDIYQFAVQVCFLDNNATTAWQWIQKAKARSLSDLLGLGALIPKQLLDQVRSDTTASELYRKEKMILQQITQSDASALIGLRAELRALRATFANHEALVMVQKLRDGTAIGIDSLSTELDDQPVRPERRSSFVFIDWYVKQDELYMLLLRPSQTPVVRRLDVAYSLVRRWLDTYLRTPEGRSSSLEREDSHPSQPLKKLDNVIEPICEYAQPDELLVFSPSGLLSSLPLHALRIPTWTEGYNRWKPTLIERNPVIYCASLTTFFQCCHKANDINKNRPGGHERKRTVFGVYEEMPEVGDDFDAEERDHIYDSVQSISDALHGQCFVGAKASTEAARQEWPKSSMIHFHGHCHVDEKEITNQALILTTATPPEEGDINDHDEHDDDEDNDEDDVKEASIRLAHLSIRDCFDISLLAPHITVLACASASQHVDLGDEPLGLLTALLCAGAASVVGTIWPISSVAARVFADYFYEAFPITSGARIEKGGSDDGNAEDEDVCAVVVDPARAVQRAVVQMKRRADTGLPWHWAPFVLHGSWFWKGHGARMGRNDNVTQGQG